MTEIIIQANEHPALVYIATLGSPRSRRAIVWSLSVVAKLLTGSDDILACRWELLRFQHTQAVRTWLAERYRPSSVNGILAALRGTLKAAWRLGLMTESDYARAVDVKGIRGETIPCGRALSNGEVAAIIQACANDPTLAGIRDAAVFVAFYPGGLRRAEVVDLDFHDYDSETGALKVRHGKGNKGRIVYITNTAKDAMDDWIRARNDSPGPLFYPVDKAGQIQCRRMTTQAVYKMLRKRGKEAGAKSFSPHDLRRTFISDLLERGADIAIVAKLAGHSSINVTARYDRRPEEAKRQAVDLLHVPYKKR